MRMDLHYEPFQRLKTAQLRDFTRKSVDEFFKSS